MSTKPIHLQIREAREARGWSQNELGRQAGMTGKAVWKIEKGHNTTIETVQRLAASLGATFDGSLRYDVSEEREQVIEAAHELPPELSGLGARVLRALPRVTPGARGILISWLEMSEAE